MPLPFRKVTENFWVSPQVSAEDVRAAAEAGFRTLVNNRPDGEDPGQPSSDEVAGWAEANGMDYVFLPFAGAVSRDLVEGMGDSVADGRKPVLAFCRSGYRSISLWAMAEALAGRRVKEDLLERGTAAGFDLSRLPL